MGLEENLPDGGVVTTSLESLVNWSRQNSTWPLLFGLACCAIEMIAAGTARHDIARYGSELFRASPRQADLMIVSGRVSNKMAPVVKRLYDQMSEPKWVIAMGICASAGGPFNNYAIVQGVDKIIPVDVYVPGCPPRPESLLYAMDKLREKQGRETFAMRRRDELERVMVGSGADTFAALVAESTVAGEGGRISLDSIESLESLRINKQRF